MIKLSFLIAVMFDEMMTFFFKKKKKRAEKKDIQFFLAKHVFLQLCVTFKVVEQKEQMCCLRKTIHSNLLKTDSAE